MLLSSLSCLSLRLTVAGGTRKASPTQTGVEHVVNLSNQKEPHGSTFTGIRDG